MLQSRTLFVVGAGASKEVGLPIGTDLAATISKKLDIKYEDSGRVAQSGDLELYGILRQLPNGEGINSYLRACWLIRDGISYATSIDDFIDTHKHDPRVTLCGKLAIVKSILEAERKSKIYCDHSNGGPRGVIGGLGSWYFELMRFLQNGIRKSRAHDIFRNCSFLVFNYDRCVEHFLHCALQNLFGISERDATDIMASLSIHHPYGTVGLLPWQKMAPGRPAVPFGASEMNHALPILVDGVRTYTERVSDPEELGLIGSMVDEADTVVFLGFSYLPQNLGLILDPHRVMKPRRILGTGIGLSQMDRTLVSRALLDLSITADGSRTEPIIENLECAQLIAQYNRFLLS